MAHKHSNLVRLAPLQVGDLPAHPDLPSSDNTRPELALLLTSLLDDGASFLSPKSLTENFTHQSTKSSPPSAAKVEVLAYSLPAAEIAQIAWSEARTVGRSNPRTAGAEHWFARKSVHQDISSKSQEKPGYASWNEFIFGLRDEHSVHESDFTPSLYDARHIVDWNTEVKNLQAKGDLKNYTKPTMAIYEMCHAIPPPLSPRCFAVLVVTASVDENSFIAVTIPVDLSSSVESAFYSVNRNVKDGTTPQQRKQVVTGVYAAVETVKRDPDKNEIEWVMATASDAKGNLPMWLQKTSVPGQIVKDVGYFLKWIKTVDDQEIQKTSVKGA